MIKFVNAKINLGLNIIGKRADGYHDLSTVFYPVGLYNGNPDNPEPFCDVLEAVSLHGAERNEYRFSGNSIDCPPEKNLVVKAAELFLEKRKEEGMTPGTYRILLDKHMPDGAGLGGGSADASFTLKLLNEMEGRPFSEKELVEMAASLGADCPFFILNRPVAATGIGEIMNPIDLNLDGCWSVLVKPSVSVSTQEAFSGVVPHRPEKVIIEILNHPVHEWERRGLKNDFEAGIFRIYPHLGDIKDSLKKEGSLYAAMSGSGSSIFGIFPDRPTAEKAYNTLKQTLDTSNRIFLIKL